MFCLNKLLEFVHSNEETKLTVLIAWLTDCSTFEEEGPDDGSDNLSDIDDVEVHYLLLVYLFECPECACDFRHHILEFIHAILFIARLWGFPIKNSLRDHYFTQFMMACAGRWLSSQWRGEAFQKDYLGANEPRIYGGDCFVWLRISSFY